VYPPQSPTITNCRAVEPTKTRPSGPGGVNVTRLSESNVPSQHCRATKVHFPSFQNDRLMERQMLEFLILPEEDAEQYGVTRNLHSQTHFIALRAAAAR
jgi:hypothetical protein